MWTPPSSTLLAGPTRVSLLNGIPIGSPVFAGLAGVPSTRTDAQTTQRAASAAISRVYVMHAMRPKCCGPNRLLLRPQRQAGITATIPSFDFSCGFGQNYRLSASGSGEGVCIFFRFSHCFGQACCRKWNSVSLWTRSHFVCANCCVCRICRTHRLWVGLIVCVDINSGTIVDLPARRLIGTINGIINWTHTASA